MKKLLFLFSLVIFSGIVCSKPLPEKSTHHIIIDTDCAIDDLRAISMLLSRPEICIRAILVSDGSLPPDEGYQKIRALLQAWHCDTIPVGVGESIEGINPPWRSFARSIEWGNARFEQKPVFNAPQLLKEKLVASEESITIVCLGALSNVYQLVSKDVSVSSKIERIIWYNSEVQPLLGFNYECNKIAADQVLQSGIRVDVISNLNKEETFIDPSFYKIVQQSETALSQFLKSIYSQPEVRKKLEQHHLMLCDDLIPVYILNPELFEINRLKENLKVRYNQDYDVLSVKEVIGDMIQGIYATEKNIVFNEFPKKKEMYTYDVRQIMDSAISRYGKEEWKANVMTDEFHGHLGVFSIVGAKMGIRAREFFGVGTDMLEVTSFAGSRPPYSCMNDGIQVSTGATLGMGTIHLSADTLIRPSAIFTYKGRSVQITLKPEYLGIVDADIDEGILKFGLLDDGYWKLIRRNAIQYWLNWNRNEIFELKEIKK